MTSALPHRTVDSPIGALTLVASDLGLRAIRFPNADPVTATLRRDPGNAVLDRAHRQLDEYFDGSRQIFDVAVDLIGTPFQVSAWHALTTIPYGTTVTYGEQAGRLGDVRRARAVGAANGRNPVPIVVPCHRVIGTNGSLIGFGGGLATKQWLLAHEGRVSGSTLL